MNYGQIKKLLSENYYDPNEIVLIENCFYETTRGGRVLRPVLLGLTNKNLAIASMVYIVKVENNKDDRPIYVKQLKLCYLYPVDVVKIFVFKQRIRKSLKIVSSHGIRYFQIASTSKTMMYWNLWCKYITELNSATKLWPFINVSSFKAVKLKHWINKSLYLGSKRESEDTCRPIPIPGLGITEEMKLSYVKPLFFGCWNQSENWIQCCCL